jgi:hypothetical protein
MRIAGSVVRSVCSQSDFSNLTNNDMNSKNESMDDSKFRDALATQSNAELEKYFDQAIPKISEAAKQAAANQDGDTLRGIVRGLGAFEAKLSEWNDACRDRASEKLIVLCVQLGEMRADINAALRGELPGQADEGEEWKNPPGNSQ